MAPRLMTALSALLLLCLSLAAAATRSPLRFPAAMRDWSFDPPPGDTELAALHPSPQEARWWDQAALSRASGPTHFDQLRPLLRKARVGAETRPPPGGPGPP